MADYTTIDDSSKYFQAETYTGGGANSTVTFSGNSDLQPDLLWIKSRTSGYDHNLFDTTRWSRNTVCRSMIFLGSQTKQKSSLLVFLVHTNLIINTHHITQMMMVRKLSFLRL